MAEVEDKRIRRTKKLLRQALTRLMQQKDFQSITVTDVVREADIKAWRDYNNLHFIQCACKFTDTCTTCNNEENQSKRVEIKELIKRLKQVNPYVEGNIFKSIENVNLSTVIAYKKDGVKHSFLEEYDD